MTLFAQLAGVMRPSGRVRAMPEEAADFILGHMRACQPILKATKKLLPHGKHTEDAHEKGVLPAQCQDLRGNTQGTPIIHGIY